MKFLLTTLTSLLLSAFASAQHNDMRFEHITINDGLSQGCVNDILQDKEGFIWIATQDGLNKYDGYSFKVYKPDSRDNQSITNNQIKKIFEDKDGIIWVGTAGGGLCKFNKKTEKFESYISIPGNKNSISLNDVYAIFEDSKGSLWIGTYGAGLNVFNKKTGIFKRYYNDPSNPQSLGGNNIREIIEDHQHRIWIGIDGGGLDLYNGKTNNFTHFKHDPKNANSLSSDDFLSIMVDHEDNLWIGTFNGGLNKFDTKTNKVEQFHHDPKNPNSLSCETVWSIFENSENSIWLGTRGGGLNIFDRKTNTFSKHVFSVTDNFSINDDKILRIFKDRSGLIWIGTETNGLNKYDDQSRMFGLYKNDPYNPQTISNSNVMGIRQQDDLLWIATRGGGLNAINPNTGKVTKYQASNTTKYDFNQLLSIEIAPEGKLWLGTELNGLFLFDPKTGNCNNYRFDMTTNPNQLSNNAVTAVVQTSDSIIWIATWGGGLNKFNYKANKFSKITIGKTYMKDVAWCITKDKQGMLWVGTNGHGLLKLNPSTGKSKYYENERNNPSSLSNNVVQSVFESSDGSLWVGTEGGGLNIFDKKHETFSAYTQKDGLPNDVILAILEDKNKNLWLSTNNGLSKFNIKTKEFTNFFEENGLQGNTFNERSCFIDSKGKMYFGGHEGLTFFDPESIIKHAFIPPVVISDFKIFNKSVGLKQQINDLTILSKPIYLTDTIVLSYKQSVFSFEFAALHFVSPSKNKFQYKMEGFDENWIDADATQRFATYTNLPGGEYLFKVRASNSDGVWNKQGVVLHVFIKPPFYKTMWFYSLLVLLIVVAIYIYIKIREKQLIKEKEHLEEMVHERTQELNQQKEELKLQSELLAKSNEELTKSNILITDSISYAKRIQEAMLPSEELIKTYLPDSFIYFRPKDIVSGDFYWFYEHNNRLFIAVADCTGHGVPGAFMSMIGNTLLNEIVIDKEESVPSEILEKLNTGVIKALNQNIELGSGQTQDDGMDISLCCIDFNSKRVEIACANHSAYIIDGDRIELVQGELYSIGGMFTNNVSRKYTNYSCPLKKGMQIYMFSDGYQDQFGGPKNKKFLASKFKDLLYANKDRMMAEHTEILDMTFETWKGRNKQIDDVLVLGLSL